MPAEWIIVARLDGLSGTGFRLTQFWTGKGWSITDTRTAKRFPTKKDAEAEAVGVVVAQSLNFDGWIVTVLRASKAHEALSVELRKA